MKKYEYTWGDTVKIVDDAPRSFRPGEFGEVCSMWDIETEESSALSGEPIGSIIYYVEFGSDGLIMEIPSRYLKKSPM